MKNKRHGLHRLLKDTESEWLEQLDTFVRFRVLPVDRMASESEISNNVESLGKMSSLYSSAQDPQGISLNMDSIPNEWGVRSY